MQGLFLEADEWSGRKVRDAPAPPQMALVEFGKGPGEKVFKHRNRRFLTIEAVESTEESGRAAGFLGGAEPVSWNLRSGPRLKAKD